MAIIDHLRKGIHDFHFGGNWTDVNLKELLSDISYQEANTQVGKLNSIVALTFHINYYIEIVIRVLKGGSLEGNDKFSFDHPDVESQEEWQAMINRSLKNSKLLSELVKRLPEEKLWATFCDEKYGNYYQNIQGIIEHCHYHLGQISLIKKMLRSY